MKIGQNISALLVGLSFLIFGFNFFFHFIPIPTPPPDSLVIPFFKSTGTSGFMAFVKLSEIIGAILIVIPRFRNWGLLILGPIMINIITFNLFIAGGYAVFQPPIVILTLLLIFVLYCNRHAFFSLLILDRSEDIETT